MSSAPAQVFEADLRVPKEMDDQIDLSPKRDLVARPVPGDPAPDVELLDPEGTRTRLSSMWRNRIAVVVFLRYFGCPMCQVHVITLREDRERFERHGAAVVLVGQGPPAAGKVFVADKKVPFDCLLDPTRAGYRTYGLGRGTLRQVFGPSAMLPMMKAAVEAETRQGMLHGGDLLQLPGTFIVDASGVVRFAHRNRTVVNNPTNDQLVRVLETLNRSAA